MVFNTAVKSCFLSLLTALRAVLSTIIILNIDVHDILSSTMISPRPYHFKRQFFPSSRFCSSSMISQPSSPLKHTLRIKNVGLAHILLPQSSPDHVHTLIYWVHACLALNNPAAALSSPQRLQRSGDQSFSSLYRRHNFFNNECMG